MRATQFVLGISSVFLGLSAAMVATGCSSEPPAGPATATAPTGDAPSAGGAPALYYFEGNVDTAKRELNVVTRTPTGGIRSQATLPYGTSNGVYFHTCSVAWNAGTKVLSGTVTAVNRTSSVVTGLTSVIDSVTPSGVTPASGAIASYGTVAAGNSGTDCTGALTWSFTNPSAGNFSFLGHATGYAGGLVALYTLDEGSGTTINDTSGNAQGMTASSGGTWPAGHLSTGHVGAVAGNAALPTTTAISISLWIKRLGTASAYPRITSLTGDALEIADYNHTGRLGVYTAGTWNDTGVTISTSSFMHVAVTADASSTLVYVNGTLTRTYGANTGFASTILYLGRRHTDATSENFNGVIDQVRVYNRTLSASEVTTLAAE